jgi:hypothetical protein
LERAAVFVSGVKQTSDVSRAVRFCLGEVEARAFYTAPPDITKRKSNKGGLGWSQDRFNQVAWSALDAVMASKPDVYGVWLSKQSSGFCATGSQTQMARVHASRENRCPNCGLVERAAHLNVCPSVVRTRLLTEGTELLENWLYQDGRTDRELAYWLIKSTFSWHSTYGISWPYVQHDASGCDQPRRYWMEGMYGRRSLQGNCSDSGRTLCRITWESARKLPSPIVGLPLSCAPLRLTIHVISVSGNQTRV